MGDKPHFGGRGTSDRSDTLEELEELVGLRDEEEELVLEWRLEQLERAGYEDAAAAELADRRDVDLHAALRLLARGCPPELAARILL